MARTIALVGALDTKGEDFAFVKRRIEQRGCKALLIDTGVLGAPSIAADINREAVAAAAGVQLSDLIARKDCADAAAAMARGATAHLTRLHAAGLIHAVMGMGGGTGTTVATTAMRALPFGVPKL